MTKVTMLGAGGRMGVALAQVFSKNKDRLQIVGAVDRAGHPAMGRDFGVNAGCGPFGVEITSDASAAIAKADVVVDFTFHTEVPKAIAEAAAKGAAYVLGTTGVDGAEAAAVRAAAERIPVVWASNFSTGINVLADLVKRAASVLGMDFDAEIVEMHHKHKRDAPSGTAITLGEAVAEGRGQSIADVRKDGRSGITGERPQGEIAFHALRGGDVVGDHYVIFANDGERLELVHKASSRECLASGAVAAAAWVAGKTPGIYSMRDVLGL